MISGRYDRSFQLDVHVDPLFELLGTPEEHKRLVLFDSGHWGYPMSGLMRECLDWLDKYLAPVRRGSVEATGG